MSALLLWLCCHGLLCADRPPEPLRVPVPESRALASFWQRPVGKQRKGWRRI